MREGKINNVYILAIISEHKTVTLRCRSYNRKPSGSIATVIVCREITAKVIMAELRERHADEKGDVQGWVF